jgi:hypothetical protein
MFRSASLSLFIVPLLVRADEPVKPQLEAQPAVLEKTKRLKPNHAVLLGQAKVVGDFNDTARKYNLHKTGPLARDFTLKMVWAPERKRALFCGANHGVPHRLNDVWEFDLASLSWVMLYAPDLPRDYTGMGKDFSDVLFKDGILVTKRGGPVVIAHTWWGLNYDPVQKAMYFMNTWVTNQKKCVEQLGGDPKELYTGPPLWSFAPSSCAWTMHKTAKPSPVAPFGGMLEYIPELGGSIWHTNNWQMQATWLYDAKKNSWKNLDANKATKDFSKHAAEPEQVGYYDSKRKIVVAHRHKATSHYDVAKNRWDKVIDAAKDSEEVPFGHDARAPMYHDPISGDGLLIQFQTNTLWSYNPDAKRWTKLTPAGDLMPTGKRRLAYFDAAHGVFVVLDGTTVWAYRHRS